MFHLGDSLRVICQLWRHFITRLERIPSTLLCVAHSYQLGTLHFYRNQRQSLGV